MKSRFTSSPRHALLHRLLATALAIVFTLGGASCDRRQVIQEPPQEVTGIARIGERVISEEAFRDLLARRAKLVPDAAASLEQRELVLEELIRAEAIYAKAIASGFEHRPDIAAAVKKLIIGRFQEEQLASRARATSVSDAEARKHYEQNQSRFITQAAVSGAVILLKTGAKAGEEQIARRREEAESIWREASDANAEQFRALAAAHSEDQATRYVGGATGWLTQESIGADWEPAIVSALFSIEQAGAVAPLVTTPRGFSIVKLIEKRVASARPFEKVREIISHQLKRAKEEEREREFYAAMKAGLNIEVNRATLQSISLPQEPKAPPRMPGAQTAKIGR